VLASALTEPTRTDGQPPIYTHLLLRLQTDGTPWPYSTSPSGQDPLNRVFPTVIVGLIYSYPTLFLVLAHCLHLHTHYTVVTPTVTTVRLRYGLRALRYATAGAAFTFAYRYTLPTFTPFPTFTPAVCSCTVTHYVTFADFAVFYISRYTYTAHGLPRFVYRLLPATTPAVDYTPHRLRVTRVYHTVTRCLHYCRWFCRIITIDPFPDTATRVTVLTHLTLPISYTVVTHCYLIYHPAPLGLLVPITYRTPTFTHLRTLCTVVPVGPHIADYHTFLCTFPLFLGQCAPTQLLPDYETTITHPGPHYLTLQGPLHSYAGQDIYLLLHTQTVVHSHVTIEFTVHTLHLLHTHIYTHITFPVVTLFPHLHTHITTAPVPHRLRATPVVPQVPLDLYHVVPG